MYKLFFLVWRNLLYEYTCDAALKVKVSVTIAIVPVLKLFKSNRIYRGLVQFLLCFQPIFFNDNQPRKMLVKKQHFMGSMLLLHFDSQKLVNSMDFKLEMPCLGARGTIQSKNAWNVTCLILQNISPTAHLKQVLVQNWYVICVCKISGNFTAQKFWFWLLVQEQF